MILFSPASPRRERQASMNEKRPARTLLGNHSSSSCSVYRESSRLPLTQAHDKRALRLAERRLARDKRARQLAEFRLLRDKRARQLAEFRLLRDKRARQLASEILFKLLPCLTSTSRPARCCIVTAELKNRALC
jgi:hypothetical protein